MSTMLEEDKRRMFPCANLPTKYYLHKQQWPRQPQDNSHSNSHSITATGPWLHDDQGAATDIWLFFKIALSLLSHLPSPLLGSLFCSLLYDIRKYIIIFSIIIIITIIPIASQLCSTSCVIQTRLMTTRMRIPCCIATNDRT